MWHFDKDGRLLSSGYRSKDSTISTVEYNYSDDYSMIQPRPPAKVLTTDGAWFEEEDLPPIKGMFWSRLKELHGVGLPTCNASRVVTEYSRLGIPVEVTFTKHPGNKVVSKAKLRSDEIGNIIEVAVLPTDNISDRRSQKIQAPSELELLVRFEYDADGHLISMKRFMKGIFTKCTSYTYNDHGDVATETQDDVPIASYKYKYDHADNWIEQVANHAQGSTLSRRIITYYEE